MALRDACSSLLCDRDGDRSRREGSADDAQPSRRDGDERDYWTDNVHISSVISVPSGIDADWTVQAKSLAVGFV